MFFKKLLQKKENSKKTQTPKNGNYTNYLYHSLKEARNILYIAREQCFIKNARGFFLIDHEIHCFGRMEKKHQKSFGWQETIFVLF